MPAEAVPDPVRFERAELQRHRDVSLLRHLLDDLLDELFQLRALGVLVGVCRVAQQLRDRVVGQHTVSE